HRGHDRFDRVGRDRFIARWMVGASVALSPKPSAKAPPQEPCPGSKAAKARGRQLARRRWQRRKGLVGEVARQAQDEGVYGTCPGGTQTWTTLLSYCPSGSCWCPPSHKSLLTLPVPKYWHIPKSCNKANIKIVTAM